MESIHVDLQNTEVLKAKKKSFEMIMLSTVKIMESAYNGHMAINQSCFPPAMECQQGRCQ